LRCPDIGGEIKAIFMACSAADLSAATQNRVFAKTRFVPR
jgi:hypothetical protein